MWHLAWTGEVTCDTYLCLRQADFQVTLAALLPVIEKELADSGWDLAWQADGPRACYRNSARIQLRTARSFLQVSFHTRIVRVDGKQHRLAGWQSFPNMRIVEPGDVDPRFIESFRALLRQAEEITDLYLAPTGPSARSAG